MAQTASLDVSRTAEGALRIHLGGDWLLGDSVPSTDGALEALRSAQPPTHTEFDTSGLGRWDTALLTALVGIRRAAEAAGVEVRVDGLPEGARRLLALAFAVKEREGARRVAREAGFLEAVGEASLGTWATAVDLVAFIGTCTQSAARLVRGRAIIRSSDMFVAIQQAGAEALPIVGLLSLLIGMIFAFVGVRQLEPFGAGIYVADLVAVAMVREMAPIMTAIIMTGRTGAAYAATLGTMKVNQEIDALASFGVDPVDFLVLPRIIALVVMVPLLAAYSSLLGIIGGALVSLTMMDVSPVQYLAQTGASMGLSSPLGGLFKALVYGTLVAIAGCQQGMAAGDSALAVGEATTRAVVMGIVLTIVSAAILTVIYINLDI